MIGCCKLAYRRISHDIIRRGYCQKGFDQLVQFPSDVTDPRNQTIKAFRPNVSVLVFVLFNVM